MTLPVGAFEIDNLVLFGSRPLGPPTTYVEDLFDGPVDTLLEDHTPNIAPAGWVWSPWKGLNGDPAYTLDGSGGLIPTDEGDGQHRGYVGDSDVSDNIRIRFSLSPNSVNPHWPILTYRKLDLSTDDNGGKLLWTRETGLASLYSPAGALLDSGTLVAGINTNIRVRLDLSGDLIVATLFNDTAMTGLTLSGTSSVQQSSTLHGLGARSVHFNIERFDNFVIESLVG